MPKAENTAIPNATETIKVALPDGRGYPIKIGEGLLEQAGSLIQPLLPIPRVVIITDSQVTAAGHLATLHQALGDQSIRHDTITLPAGEATKSFSQLEHLLDQLLALKPERRLTLIALGGGVIGDITGFAASILLRGVPFIQIPTTLLAMVDSSVGGKTGINTRYGKNLVGSFYQPRMVIADTATLRTLPRREVLAGYAEVVKYGLINKPELFSLLQERAASLHGEDLSPLYHQDIIATCCQAKAEIVAADEHEGGQRALLNLGHTFGHALEAEMGYDGRLLHGEAVATGMVMAFQFSHAQRLCPAEHVRQVIAHLEQVGLPAHPSAISPDFTAQALLNHMGQDKKVEDGKLVCILARGIGKAYIDKQVSHATMLTFLNNLLTAKP